MDLNQALLEARGIAPAPVLLRIATRHDLGVAVRNGGIVRVGRGRCSLPDVDEHRAAAARLSRTGATSRSPAERGWTYAGAQRLRRSRRPAVTSKVRTVLDCARWLAFDAALAVVDSALRSGVTKTELLLACARLPRTGRSRAYGVIEQGDARAANPFESVLRAMGLNRDMERYNGFLGEGYVMVRFGWKHAMFEQDYVRATVGAVTAPQGRSVRWCPRCDAA